VSRPSQAGAGQVGAVEEWGVGDDLEGSHGVLGHPEQSAVVEHEVTSHVGCVSGPRRGEVAVLVEQHLRRAELVPACGGRAQRLRRRLLRRRRGDAALAGIDCGEPVAILPLEGEGDTVEVRLGRGLPGRRQNGGRHEQSEGCGAEEGEPPTLGLPEL
jgi:hypothetical protein